MSTAYWFSVGPRKLLDGVRFLAAFARAPLFTPSLAAREVHAVDAEFRRNEQNDARRVLQLAKHLSVEGHAFRKFGTGNYASLSAVGRREGEPDKDDAEVMLETRRRLVEWWKEEYCPSRMTVAMLGKGPSSSDSIPEIYTVRPRWLCCLRARSGLTVRHARTRADSFEDMIAVAVPLFSQVPERGGAQDPRPAIKAPAWGPEHKGVSASPRASSLLVPWLRARVRASRRSAHASLMLRAFLNGHSIYTSTHLSY